MGHMQAMEMRDRLQRESLVEWHLMYNHYPPPPHSMVQIALDALTAIEEGERDRMIDLPEGIMFRDDSEVVSASQVADSFHLWDFVEDDEI